MEYFFKFLSSLAWPCAFIYVCYLFKEPISKLLARLKSTNFSGNSFDFTESSKQDDNITKDFINEEKKSPHVAEIYESQSIINQQMLTNMQSDEKVTKHCREYFSFILLNFIFYKIYTNIFGTQIALLFYLQNIHQAGLEQLIEFYNQGKNQSPEVYSNIKFDAYLGFLTNNGLIEKKDQYYHLTSMGRDFIKFLVLEKLPGRNF